jgi:hypothetical protein
MRAIHCKTKEEFIEVLKEFDRREWKWSNKESPLYLKGREWDVFKSETSIDYCNNFMFGTADFRDKLITFETFKQELKHVK